LPEECISFWICTEISPKSITLCGPNQNTADLPICNSPSKVTLQSVLSV